MGGYFRIHMFPSACQSLRSKNTEEKVTVEKTDRVRTKCSVNARGLLSLAAYLNFKWARYASRPFSHFWRTRYGRRKYWPHKNQKHDVFLLFPVWPWFSLFISQKRRNNEYRERESSWPHHNRWSQKSLNVTPAEVFMVRSMIIKRRKHGNESARNKIQCTDVDSSGAKVTRLCQRGVFDIVYAPSRIKPFFLSISWGPYTPLLYFHYFLLSGDHFRAEHDANSSWVPLLHREREHAGKRFAHHSAEQFKYFVRAWNESLELV